MTLFYVNNIYRLTTRLLWIIIGQLNV